MNRREFLKRLVLGSVFLGVGITGIAEIAEKLTAPSISQPVGSIVPTVISTQTQSASTNTSQTSGTTSSSVPPGYIFVTAVSYLASKTYAYFNHPNFGTSILINYNGGWSAFSAVCTHAGCTVNFTGSSLYCPCHNANFSAANGSVQSGPPPTRLAEYGVKIVNGNLYVSTAVIN